MKRKGRMKLLETRIKGKNDISFMVHSIYKLSDKEKLYNKTRVKLKTFIQNSYLFKHALDGMFDFYEKEGVEQLFATNI